LANFAALGQRLASCEGKQVEQANYLWDPLTKQETRPSPWVGRTARLTGSLALGVRTSGQL